MKIRVPFKGQQALASNQVMLKDLPIIETNACVVMTLFTKEKLALLPGMWTWSSFPNHGPISHSKISVKWTRLYNLSGILLPLQPLQWRHDERDGVSNYHRLDYLLSHLFTRRSKKTSKLRVTGLCEGNSPVPSEFPAQRASDAKNVSIWWRHHDLCIHHYAVAVWLCWNVLNVGSNVVA